MRLFRIRRRDLARLIRSAKTEFTVSEALVDRVQKAVAAPMPANVETRTGLEAGKIAFTAAFLVVLAATGFWFFPRRGNDAALAAAELARARSSLVQAPFVHYLERSWTADDTSEWVLDFGEEAWQAEGRQWRSVIRKGRPSLYAHWPGPGHKQVWYSPGSRRLRESGAGPMLFMWDWESMLTGSSRGLKGNSLSVQRLDDRVWQKRRVRVYRLDSVEPASRSEQVFFVDAETGLTVREEGIIYVSKPEKRTSRLERDIDYTPFDPDKLFDPRKMAEDAGVALSSRSATATP